MSILGFLGKKKSPADLVKTTISAINDLKADNRARSEAKSGVKPLSDKKRKSLTDRIQSNLLQIKQTCYGDGDNKKNEDFSNKLIDEVFRNNFLGFLLANLSILSFEPRRHVAQLYNFMARESKQRMTNYLLKDEDRSILTTLVRGYESDELALLCGDMLRETIRLEPIHHMLINSSLFYEFFKYVKLSKFDVASDAFWTFENILRKHNNQMAKFLLDNFDAFFKEYNLLMVSRNYVTKRQSLKLLSEILLIRSNFEVMMRYINDPENLTIIMYLLKSKTEKIRWEAFHVFKIVGANPRKSLKVQTILYNNRQKLMDMLEKMLQECRGKESTTVDEEINILLDELKRIEAPKQPDESKDNSAPPSSSSSTNNPK